MTDAALTRTLARRDGIRARIAQQRAGVESAMSGLAQPVALIDGAVHGVRYLRTHPAALGLLVAAAVVLRGRTLVGLAARGIGLWRLLRQVRRLLAGLV